MRQQQWTVAGTLLETAFNLDPSRPNAAAALPAITQIARHDARQVLVLARVLLAASPAAAQSRLAEFMDEAAADADYWGASVAAGWLCARYRDTGRLPRGPRPRRPGDRRRQGARRVHGPSSASRSCGCRC